MAKYFKGVNEINSAVARAVKNSVSVQDLWQKIIVSALIHLQEHGTKSVVENVVSNITACNGVQHYKMKSFTEVFCHGTIDKKTGELTYDDGFSHKQINIAQAEAVKWYDFKAPKTESTDTLDKVYAGTLTRLTKLVGAEIAQTVVDGMKATVAAEQAALVKEESAAKVVPATGASLADLTAGQASAMGEALVAAMAH